MELKKLMFVKSGDTIMHIESNTPYEVVSAVVVLPLKNEQHITKSEWRSAVALKSETSGQIMVATLDALQEHCAGFDVHDLQTNQKLVLTGLSELNIALSDGVFTVISECQTNGESYCKYQVNSNPHNETLGLMYAGQDKNKSSEENAKRTWFVRLIKDMEGKFSCSS